MLVRGWLLMVVGISTGKGESLALLLMMDVLAYKLLRLHR
jgi:hypothetical protein